jgi:hypothetical protein
MTTFDVKKKAIDLFVNTFGGSYKKQLDPLDIDFKIFDANGRHIAYADIIYTPRAIHQAYPLKVSSKRLVKLMDKRISGVVIWSCADGIIYSKLSTLHGVIMWSAENDLECSFDKSKTMKYIKYS